MAELAISAATSILVELAVTKILEKLDVNRDVENDVQCMRSWLGTMQAYVEANSDRRGDDRRLDAKVEQVRNIAFEIKDVLDEIVLHSTRVFHRHRVTQKAYKLGHNIRHGFPLHGISEKIATIKRKLEDIKSQTAAFPDRSSGSSGSRIGHQLSTPLLDNEMVGYTNLMETFTNLLTAGEKRLVTLAVVGPAGAGKTTFVNTMFGTPRIRRRFHCHALVHVSKEFDLKAIYNDMLNQFWDRRKESYYTVSEALTRLRKYLEKRRYVIVVDDIWKKEHWDRIKDALPDGLLCSRIIVSTSASNVASLCASSPQFVHEIKGLERPDAWSLFCKIAFKDYKGECPAEFKTCSLKILDRCEGLPLLSWQLHVYLSRNQGFRSNGKSFTRVLDVKSGAISTILFFLVTWISLAILRVVSCTSAFSLRVTLFNVVG